MSTAGPAGEQAPAWHALGIDEVLKTLATGPAGLAVAEAERRLALHGPNLLPEPAGRSLLRIVLGQLASPLILLLLAAAAVSLVLGELADAGFILLVLAINTAIGATQEARAEAHTAALRRSVVTGVRARRDGAVRRIDGGGLVPGDVVLLEAGDRVPADVRVLTAADLQADEALLTGESAPVRKAAQERGLAPDTPLAERADMLHAGTTVQRGQGEALVVATGRTTAFGQIAEALLAPPSPPPLTRRLDRFSRNLGIATVFLVGAIVAVRLLLGAPLGETLLVAIALAVSVIPEGLPVAVTVALSIATRRMARRNVIVRELAAVEGLGACTVIATDKTGTLTVNQLTAKRLWLPGSGPILVEGEGYRLGGFSAADGGPLPEGAQRQLALLGQSASHCNDATWDPALGAAGASGDSVDLAFLVLAEKASPGEGVRAPRIAHIPFDAARRYAASLNRHEDGPRLHVKGAAEVVVPMCRDADAPAVMAAAEAMAAEGFRVLAVAVRRLDDRVAEDWESLENELGGLTLLGLVGFIDPLRPEARQAVLDCRRAGVAVKMITGDHAGTALAIARQLAIAQTPGEVVGGRDLAARAGGGGDAARIARASVFARVEPMQKVEIVEVLRGAGHIVAMTGDGVNDAPALQRADIGVAMGQGGTDVARQVADLVLTDDNFASVVAGIEEGRAAYANIRKVIYLLVSTGAAEVVLFLIAVATALPVPLGAVQLLWLNLVTNGGQDVALAFEKREAGLLDRPPRRPDEPIFDPLMLRQVAVSGIFMGAVAWGVFALALAEGWSEFQARNLLLFLMVLFENVHVFNCRSETRSAFAVPLANNWPLLAAAAGAQAVHVGAAFVPGLAGVLAIEPMAVEMWLLLVPVAASVLLVMEADKALRRRRGQRGQGVKR